MEWTGFTDEQLKRLKTSESSTDQNSRQHTQGYHDRPHSTARLPPQRSRGRPAHVQKQSLNPNQMLSKPRQGEQSNYRPDRTKTPVKTDENLTIDESDRTMEKPVHDRLPTSQGHKPPEVVSSQGKRTEFEENNVGGETKKDESIKERTIEDVVDKKEALLGKELNEKEGLSRELTKLEQFQQQQKEIEDGNMRKKNLLTKEIANRKKKTQEEAKRLAFIQKELSKIDEFLTNDVNILRDKIEEASMGYMEARKRYQKAETEYISAKIHLHKTSEQKEALTEHLCTIIRMNELRKSEKLEELVEKLEGVDVDKLEAEMESEKKAESQAPSISEESKRTLSTSSTGDVPIVENAPLRSDGSKIVEDSITNVPQQGQSSSSPPAGDNTCALQDEVLPNSTLNKTSEIRDDTEYSIKSSDETGISQTKTIDTADSENCSKEVTGLEQENR